MKSIILPCTPAECEKIVNGYMSILVRKVVPKETPFKVYVYETQGATETPWVDEDGHFIYKGRGKVIGEFICNKVDKFYCASVPYKKENNLGYGHFVDNGVYKVDGWHEGVVFERNDRYIDTMLNNNDLKEMCLSAQKLFDYIGIGKHLYGLHISDLKIYDEPKELSEFRACNGNCNHCKHRVVNPNDVGDVRCENKVTRPPKNYIYVEE